MKKNEKILLEIYRRLYSASTPSANFDELMANATINDMGQKEIPFMDYEIDGDLMQSIIDGVMEKNRVPVYQRKQFNVSVYLGCSPKTKRNG